MQFSNIIDKYYPIDNELKQIFIAHAEKVAEFSLKMSHLHPELKMDESFLYEAAMLHDIGIFMTQAPRIHCFGQESYIAHGYLGAQILYNEGLPRHALVCERHTGIGLTKDQIVQNNLPVPQRDMFPISLEEQAICFADLFYSKTRHLHEPRTLEQVKQSVSGFSTDAMWVVGRWAKLFL